MLSMGRNGPRSWGTDYYCPFGASLAGSVKSKIAGCSGWLHSDGANKRLSRTGKHLACPGQTPASAQEALKAHFHRKRQRESADALRVYSVQRARVAAHTGAAFQMRTRLDCRSPTG